MLNKLKTDNITYENYTIINFVNTSDVEKKMILDWRNNDNVRKWMLDKKKIDLETHYKYIESLKDNENKLCFIVKNEEVYIGIFEFDEIDLVNKTACFGLNASPHTHIKGVGSILIKISLYLAQQFLHLDILKLYVNYENKNAVNLYKKFKFAITCEKNIAEENYYFMEKIL